MSITPLNIGSAPNDGNGQDLRSGGQVINDNFAELDTRTNAAQAKADAAQPKEAGKGLSANDYSAEEKEKVAAAIPGTQKGAANGVATLGADAKILAEQLAIALVAIGALTPASDMLPYFNGATTAAITSFTAKARALLARTNTAGMQAELALVKASLSSITAGEVLQVGHAGWNGGGGFIQGSAVDANNVTASGVYIFSAGGNANIPVNIGYMIVYAHPTAGYCRQVFKGFNSNAYFERYQSAGAWGAWDQVYGATSAVLDPQTAGGLMSRTVVSGFDVFKYANGQCIAQGPIPTTASVPANTDSSISIAVPSVFNAGNTTLLATLYPSVGNDFSIKNTQAPGSTAFVFIRNGTSAQTFSGNLLLLGRWK
ncbi:pyocin knob domain-containing protein [Pseudomonas fluorescens]|uniref:pyocin knob domain-containing protein n=1 Tax=Pseudomonas fluorescens TaxID=294 RepID=UPI001D0D500D|nr:pyocin knob domain-containing protein [Pseudomonas fluorescens]